MKTKFAALVGVLMGVAAATPVLAQGQACLQRNRMQSWHPINDYILDFTDIIRHHYTVYMASACRGVGDPRAHLIFHIWLNLQCLPQGEIVTVVSPLFGHTQCSVSGVQANLPFNPGYGTSG
jgi:hypothetical protein